MGWDEAFAAAATYVKPESFETFRRAIKPAWIEMALTATGTATVRRRRLPEEEVIWVVLGMALFRDRRIEDVVSKLDLALPGGGGTVARSSVAEARARLGSEPMKWLFERSASEWAHTSAAAHRWRGLSLYGIDGSRLRVPDTEENRAHFGGQSGRKGSESGYPMARVVALMVQRSHLLAGVWFGPYGGTHELAPAKELQKTVPDESLTVVAHRRRSPSSLAASSRRRCCSESRVPDRTVTGSRAQSRRASGGHFADWAKATSSSRWTSRVTLEAKTLRCHAPGRCERFATNERASLRRRCSRRCSTPRSIRPTSWWPVTTNDGSLSSATTSSRRSSSIARRPSEARPAKASSRSSGGSSSHTTWCVSRWSVSRNLRRSSRRESASSNRSALSATSGCGSR